MDNKQCKTTMCAKPGRKAFIGVVGMLAISMLLAMTMLACSADSGKSSVAGRYSAGGTYIELNEDGTFTLDMVNYQARTGTYSQADDGSLSFEATKVGRAPAQTFTAILTDDTLTINATEITLLMGDESSGVQVGTTTLSGWEVTLNKE